MKFVYKAKKDLNEISEGVIEAESQEAALSKLAEKGLFPIEIGTAVKLPKKEILEKRTFGSFLIILREKITSKDILTFTQKLATLVRAKVELLSTLKILYEQTEKLRFRKIILEIYNDVKEGKEFSESLKKFPNIFPPLFVSIIKSGEATGRLDDSLEQISEFLSKQEKLRTKVAVALAYPIFILFVGLISVFVLMSFVIPKLKIIFTDMGENLPLLTRIIFKSSTFFKESLPYLIIILVIFLVISFRKSNLFLRGIKKLKRSLPIIGKLVKKQELLNLSRSLRLLLKSGVSVLKSLQIVTVGIEVPELKKQFDRVCESLAAGETLAKSIQINTSLPGFFIKMIAVGEKSGRLEEVLNEISSSYNQQIEADIGVITSLLEPILILFLGIILGTIVISILLPIFQITLMVH